MLRILSTGDLYKYIATFLYKKQKSRIRAGLELTLNDKTIYNYNVV